MTSFAQRSVTWMLLLAALTLNGSFSDSPLNASSSPAERESAEQAILQAAAILSAKGVDPRQRSLALASYRSAVMRLLPILKGNADASHEKHQRKFFNPHDFSEVAPVERSRISVSGLHRDGLGLPVIGRIAQSGVTDPNAPPSGFVLAATALVLPDSDGRMDLFFADPTRVETIDAFEKELPVAMDLEAWLDAVEATAPPFGAGFRYMLRSNKFDYQSCLIFLQPFDPDKTPSSLSTD